MRYKTVLFDFDGTLVDSERSILPCAKKTLEIMGYEIPEYNAFRKFIGPPLAQSFAVCGVPEEKLEQATKIYREIFFRESLNLFEYYEGMENLLVKLKEKGVNIAVASVRIEKSLFDIAKHLPIEKYFDAICGRIEEEGIVTKADVVRHALESMGVTGENAVLIGDSKYDDEGAKEAGVDFIAAMYGFGFDSEEDVKNSVKNIYSVKELEDFLL